MTSEQGLLLNLAASSALAGKPLILAAAFTQGVDKLIPIGDAARRMLEGMCPPSSEGHTWTTRGPGTGDGLGLLVERRYANDLIAALRAKGAHVS